jgi:hypothetical protein
LSEIRSLARADLSAVAALFQRTFRDPEKAAPRSLETYLAEAFLDHPWFDPEVASRVHTDADGKVTGFIGVFPGRFEYRGRTIRAAIAGSLMVENYEREPLAGAKLLRSVVKGPQDISISETTNLISKRLWEPLGGKVVPLLSLDWFRVFHPGTAALAMLTERVPAGRWLSPAATALDWIGGAWTRRSLRPVDPPARLVCEKEPTDAAFASAVVELAKSAELRPAWSESHVEWLLAHASRKERYGTMHRTIVRDRKGGLVGCYVYHADAKRIGRVLQLLARPSVIGDVVDCLFAEAHHAGLAGLRGRSAPGLMTALLTRNCIYLHRASTVFHTGDRELAETIEAQETLITGLAGESWTRLVGDEFV